MKLVFKDWWGHSLTLLILKHCHHVAVIVGFFLFWQSFFNFGEVLMLCALMWIARCAWMRALMNLQSFVELERLLQIGLQGWFPLSFVKTRIVDKIWFENWIYLEQWVVLFPLRRPWLLDYLCSNLPYHKFKNFLKRGPQSMLNTWFLVTFFFALWVFQEFAQFYKNSSLLIISLDGKIGSAMFSFSISVVTKC